jgi:hypothetical protein
VVALLAVGCGVAAAPTEAAWPPRAKQWYQRADTSYRRADLDDAQLAADNALRLAPKRVELRTLAARIALAALDCDRAVQLLAGIDTADARGIRGRALWYSYRIEQAADELEKLLADPDVRDPWAVETLKLARRGGGREPFRMGGGLLAATDMPHVNAASMIIPLEVNGEPAFGLVATNVPEAVIDSSAGAQPSWISLRFGERVEVEYVPALAQDLSGVSRQLNVPIKILVGVNLLRHLHATLDYSGHQFVVRTFESPPPPRATTLKLAYVRGGGMVVRGALGSEESAPRATLLIDTSMTFPIALDTEGWKKAGVRASELKPIPDGGGLKQGTVPLLKIGAYELPEVPGVAGSPTAELEKSLGIQLDGVLGAGLFGAFRVTLADGGRTMWLEDMPAGAAGPSAAPPPPADAPAADEPDEGDEAEEGDAEEDAEAPAPPPKAPPKKKR